MEVPTGHHVPPHRVMKGVLHLYDLHEDDADRRIDVYAAVFRRIVAGSRALGRDRRVKVISDGTVTRAAGQGLPPGIAEVDVVGLSLADPLTVRWAWSLQMDPKPDVLVFTRLNHDTNASLVYFDALREGLEVHLCVESSYPLATTLTGLAHTRE